MTTTYDPFHPKYFDEADLREEMDRVYDLCHGCRLCFKFCDAFPTLFEFIDVHDDQDTLEDDPGPAGPGRRRVLQLQALLRQLSLHPGPARVGARLPSAHAAGRAGALKNRKRSVKDKVTDLALGSTDLVGKVNTDAGAGRQQGVGARPAPSPQARREGGRHRLRAHPAAVRQAALLHLVREARPLRAGAAQAGAGRAVPHLP